jgi:multisubunit Na+/H+ antiporter MnhE subunit
VAERKRGRAVQTRAQRISFWLTWWAIGFGLWVLLVFKTEPAEFVAGALTAAVAATGVELVRSRGYAPFAPDPRWAWAGLHVFRDVVRDTWRMAALLVRHLVRGDRIQGSFRIVEFSVGERHDPRAEARRAVAEWLGCVTPNTYVIGIDEHHRVAVIHQLVRDELPPELAPPE